MLSQKEKDILAVIEKRQKFLLAASIVCILFALSWVLGGFCYYRDYASKLCRKADWVDSIAPRTAMEAELKTTSQALLSVFTKHSGKITALWAGLVFCSFLAFSVFIFGIYSDRKEFLAMIHRLLKTVNGKQ